MQSIPFMTQLGPPRFIGRMGRVCLGVMSLCAAATPVQSLELGAAQSLAGLGQPLSLQVPVRFAEGKAPRSDCLKVRVEAGDRLLSDGEIQQGWSQGKAGTAMIWVRSRVEVTEPLLRLSMGCPQQQLVVFVDPVPALQPTAAGPVHASATPAAPAVAPEKPVVPGVVKVKAEPAVQPKRTGAPVLRMDDPGLPALTLPDPEVPGLRFRFDTELHAANPKQPTPGGREPKAKPERRVSLLMAIDVGRALGPGDLLAIEAGQGSSSAPARLQRAQKQFEALQADQRALHTEMNQLLAEMERRRQESLRNWRLAGIVTLGLVVLGVGLYFMSRHRRRP